MLKRISTSTLSLLAVAGFLFSVFFIASVVEHFQDKNTIIIDAVVLSKEKSNGTRRSLPVYYLTVKEIGETDSTRVKVDMGTWVVCQEGNLFNDKPGVSGYCSNPFKPSIKKQN